MATLLPGIDVGVWIQVKDGHHRFADLYRRHYSCRQYADNRRSQAGYRNRNLVLGPGEKMALLTPDWQAAFGWRRFINDSGQTGVNCAFFRNEGQQLSSYLILEAEKIAWARWPGQRLYTYVDATAVKSTNPGYCYLKAGWRKCGFTQVRQLVILEKLPLCIEQGQP
jgi:hypothetical protein